MKIILIATLAVVAMSQKNCSDKKLQNKESNNCYKARLEIKGICSNYTIKLLEGSIDTSKIVAAWTDETTGKSYSNVFGLGSPCSFPSTINAGDEFYFVLNSAVQNCSVCMAYYPHPARALNIKVISGPCK
jgi:hypothetical protein